MASAPRRTFGIAKPSVSETSLNVLDKVWVPLRNGRMAAEVLSGGWDRETEKIDPNVVIQIEKAFDNVECALKAAGSRGWEDVFFLRSHHLPCNNEAIETMVRCLKKYCPNHQPTWTALGVPRLALDDMRVEIEVRAHVPKDREEK